MSNPEASSDTDRDIKANPDVEKTNPRSMSARAFWLERVAAPILVLVIVGGASWITGIGDWIFTRATDGTIIRMLGGLTESDLKISVPISSYDSGWKDEPELPEKNARIIETVAPKSRSLLIAIGHSHYRRHEKDIGDGKYFAIKISGDYFGKESRLYTALGGMILFATVVCIREMDPKAHSIEFAAEDWNNVGFSTRRLRLQYYIFPINEGSISPPT